MKKAKQQQEFPGMPQMSALAEAATKYLNERDELDKQKEVVEDAKQALATEFQKANISKIRVAACTIVYRHKETESITVKKDPQTL